MRLCLVPYLRGQYSLSLTFGLLDVLFIRLRGFPSILHSLRVFNYEWISNLSEVFLN